MSGEGHGYGNLSSKLFVDLGPLATGGCNCHHRRQSSHKFRSKGMGSADN